MNTILWIIQGLLAAMFLMGGLFKATQTKALLKEKGGENMAWVDSVSASNIKLIGVVEVLGGIGLIVPQLTGILPWLTSLAAVGLACTMIGAALLHVKRGDGAQSIVTNLVLLGLAGFVAYGRYALLPA